MGCDGYITFKVLELILSIACIIFKRVTDDKSSKLFFYLQKQSREWPLLNNIFWDENGAIFADMTYGGFVIICSGLIIGQAKGELRHAKYTENFLLTMGALMYIGSASLELAALDSVQPNLVVNAAILGVVSLVTGLIFILDLLLAGRRRKKRSSQIGALGYEKQTQTDGSAKNLEDSAMEGVKKPPINGIKILPTGEQAYPQIPVMNSNNEYVGSIAPIYSPHELKSSKVQIKSTESFLRSEKGEMPVVRKAPASEDIYVPPGFVLVPARAMDESHTPPGYASVDPKFPTRKTQSPTVTTTSKTPAGYYYQNSREPSPSDEIYIGKLPPQMKAWSKGHPDETDSPFRRNSPFRTSKLSFPVDVEDSSLNGHKIEEELKRIRDITKADVDLTAEIAKENQALKNILRKEKEEKLKLKNELEKSEIEERKRLEDRVNELEEYQSKLEKELKIEERKKLEQKIKELEAEKDRRVSEKEVQYFGVDDLRQSKREELRPNLAQIEEYFRNQDAEKKGVTDVNTKLKEKISDEEELRRVIEDGFHFLNEEDRKKQRLREDEDFPSRGETPGSFKSEAQFWLGNKEAPPISPKDPGYVLHTVQNWPDPSSPNDRFRFSAQKAHKAFSVTPSPERGSSEEEDKFKAVKGRGKGMLLRKVDFPEVEIERPSTVAGSSSTWRRWLQNSNKPKLHVTRSTPQ